MEYLLRLDYQTLYTLDGLHALQKAFLHYLEEHAPDLCQQYQNSLDSQELKQETSPLALAPYIEDFIGEFFKITSEVKSLQNQETRLSPLFRVKRQFIQRVALRTYSNFQAVDRLDLDIFPHTIDIVEAELAFSELIEAWLENEEHYATKLDTAAKYASWATFSVEGQKKHKHGVLFHIPQKLDFNNLVSSAETPSLFDEGFNLRDKGLNTPQAQDQTNYCILCHPQKKDTCSKGYGRKNEGERFAQNPLKNTLIGCPLEQKISEAHVLKRDGLNIAALAMIMVDNPMLALTGHRICNECTKACIYQKQEPVDIPGIETQILRSVLALPYGVEIYSLLSRWSPLNLNRPLPKNPTGKRVLVVGAGPAGINLSHHLLQDGHTVVMAEGSKVAPWPISESLIKNDSTIYEELEDRTIQGFGGVSEYGITVRWDKNFLTLARLLLERRDNFLLQGNTRFGGTLTEAQAFDDLGFDHIALCMGAGSPTILDIRNNLAIGVRQASDFLMSLQLTGAYQKKNIANLNIHLPIVVIGGGLTAIDTATEALHYYPRYVEKVITRLQALSPEARKSYEHSLTPAEIKALRELHQHHALFEEARTHGKDILSIIQQLGGVKVLYRRSIQESPAYRLNHEELQLALEEGIEFIEYTTPLRIRTDVFGHAKGMYVLDKEGNEHYHPARTILIAAGTKPNTNILYDDPDFAPLQGHFFQAIDESGNSVSPEPLAKPETPHILLKKREDAKSISFFGDMHPSFAGSVVKAMASAKRGYPVISNLLKDIPEQTEFSRTSEFLKNVHQVLSSTVKDIIRHTPTIIEIIIHAPMAAKNFQPGMFYKLQNFTPPLMEPLALTGAWVDKDRGLISLIVLEMGGSSRLCSSLKPGDPVALMGPTGMPTEIPFKKNILLIGGGLGNAVLFSIGQALRKNGCHVTYFAGYRSPSDLFKREEIEAAADKVIWASDTGTIHPSRSQDQNFTGNILQALIYFGNLLGDIDHIITIGSDRMMAAIAHARHHALKPFLKANHTAVGSINAPMQCMMKGVCAQCVQRHIDPQTGDVSYIYSCAQQDQNLDKVDFGILNARLTQNGLQEKMG